MPSVSFQYTPAKDASNIIRGLSSVNNSVPTSVERLYLSYAKNASNERAALSFVQEYVHTHKIDIYSYLASITDQWSAVEQAFFQRATRLFQCAYPLPTINAYLTINSRCTYSTTDNLFYVSIGSKHPRVLIMHEVFHLYTWHALGLRSLDDIRSLPSYNELKESLTVLLNILFADLMDGAIDRGYTRHAELRALIVDLWYRHKDFYAVLDDPVLLKRLRE